MITLEAYQLLIAKKWRWLWIICMISLYSFLRLISLPANVTLSVMEFVILVCNQHFFIIALIPLLFLVIITDLLGIEHKTTFMHYAFVRNHSRWRWFMAKLTVLFLASFLLIIINLLIITSTALLAGLSWTNHVAMFDLPVPPIISLISILSLTVCSLFYFGSLVTMFALWCNRIIGVWIFGSTVAFVSYFTWFKGDGSVVKWLPTTHMMYFLHVSNSQVNAIAGFTLSWSFVYTLLSIICCGCIGFFILRPKNLVT